ncbi:MAG TPA: glycosyltransferase [Gemmatimonadota bacterium]|nr:glycosyltransferase [Gemmatimonadota bacterium]
MRHVPRVTVGLPVHNGEAFLSEAIESVLGQTFEDLVLVVCDNASTDRTPEILRRYRRQDPRVVVHRNEVNVGAAKNFNLAFELARGPLFRWMAADDILEPTCLERCVEVLDADRRVVLSHTDVEIVDGSGRVVEHFRYPPGHASSDSPSRRFLDVMRLDRWCAELFGLVRSDVLRTTRLMDGYVASDRVLRAELALRGRFQIVPEPLFLNRDHPGRSVRALPAHHLRGEWFSPSLAGRRILPHWRILTEYVRCIRRSPISPAERRRCYAHTLRWLGIHANWARLGADVVIAAWPASWESLWRASRAADGWLRAGGGQPRRDA